ncbi:MAG TPA: TIM barrel protein [Dehalococcoidia bacterium]|nr:TIM barrel protein [Dehalococcoidia bacterium]
MIFGAISNSWRQQLAHQDLADLVKQAQDQGSKHVELRQTCLGGYEQGEGTDWRPVWSKMRSLVDGFPQLTFDLAMAMPCLSQRIDPRGGYFQAALEGARLVGGSSPHLRTVDPSASGPAWEKPADIPETALGLVELTREAAHQGVVLSMENSSQTIGSMALLVREIRSRLPEAEGKFLGLCPDPTNQLRRFPETDPIAELDALPLDMIKIVHFKQARDGKPHPTVDTGDLDCISMLRVLEAKGYRGPAIMEIPPHEDVFENLSASFAYLETGSRVN